MDANVDWRPELNLILAACVEQATLPVSIKSYHRDANLPFEALLSLVDVLAVEFHAEAIALSNDRLADLPADCRQQQVTADTLPALLDAPSWSLVRGLGISIHDPSVASLLDDPRLNQIEEIALYWYGVDFGELDTALFQAIVQSPAFLNVRSLIFHAVESSPEISRLLWSSPLVRRLARIENLSYCGGLINGPLPLEELSLSGYDEAISEGFSFRPLLDPAITPRLSKLSLSASRGGVADFLTILSSERRLFERIAEVSLHLGVAEADKPLLRKIKLPRSMHTITCGPDFYGLDLMPETPQIKRDEIFTEYFGLGFEWRDRNDIPRGLNALPMVLPPGIDMQPVVEFLGEFPSLQLLGIVHPLTSAEFELLARSPIVQQLQNLQLALEVDPSQRATLPPQPNPRDLLVSSPAPVFTFAGADAIAHVPHVLIRSPTCGIMRTHGRLKCSVSTREAAQALLRANLQQPLQSLDFDFGLHLAESDRLRIDGRLAREIVTSGLLGRTYALDISATLDEEAAGVLARCEQLGNVRRFQFFAAHNSQQAIQILLQSPHWRYVWELDVCLPDETKLPHADSLLADSPLLDHAIVFSYDGGVYSSTAVPQSGRLGRVRRLMNPLSIRVENNFATLAEWMRHPLSRPLRAKLAGILAKGDPFAE